MRNGIGTALDPDKERTSTWTLGAVGLAGATLNIPIVYGMALAAGYPAVVAWLFWVILDFFELSSMRVCLRTQSSKIRRWAGGSAVFGLVISALAAGLHVFLEDGRLPKWVSFLVLMLPAVMLGLSLHQVMLLRIERLQRTAELSEHLGTVSVGASGIALIPNRHADDVETRLASRRTAAPAVTSVQRGSGRQGTKRARFEAALAAVPVGDRRSTNDLVAALNQGIELHPGTARRLVGEWRHSRGSRLEAVGT